MSTIYVEKSQLAPKVPNKRIARDRRKKTEPQKRATGTNKMRLSSPSNHRKERNGKEAGGGERDVDAQAMSQPNEERRVM